MIFGCGGKAPSVRRHTHTAARSQRGRKLSAAMRSAARYSVVGNFAGSGGYAATAIGSSASLFSWSGAFSQASVKPAAPTAATATLVVRVRLANFFNVASCTLTLQGSLGKRPDL
jgi:hypothetical protein